MPDDLLTLATFPSPTEAGFFRSLLESEGIPSYLSDEATVSINPLLGNTIGWVKLQVAERDLDRAIELLESRKNEAAGISPEELAGEALEEPAEDAELETEDGQTSTREERETDTEDWLEDPQEDLARRAFRASVLGWAFFPLVFYAVWLVGRLIFSKGEWSARTSRNAWSAALMILIWFASVWLFYSALEGMVTISE
jgi:hypothetical protein